MPWKETFPMDQREKFINDLKRGSWTVTELCERYNVSRKTGYKWINRYEQEGRNGLGDRSRRPKTCPHQISEWTAEAICKVRKRHPSWGPEKILQYLRARQPRVNWPATSTAGDLLARKGMVKRRPRRRKAVHPGAVPAKTKAPNDIWAADFKGHFKTKNGVYCYPLTITDEHTRFLLECHGLKSTKGAPVKAVFDRVFREYGLPSAIRTDNGVPFATTGIHGLSHLNVWWMRLGIQHQRIEPGHPEQNGKHERMHRTLKADATKPPMANLSSQQRKFNSFRHMFNWERPHQALKGQVPGKLYEHSLREYDGKIPPLEYPGHYVIKRVTNAGTFRLRSKLLFVSKSLERNLVGLEEIDDGVWAIYLGNVLLAKVDERDYVLQT